MNAYLIDTSIIVGFLRNRKEIVEFVKNLTGQLASSFICLAELYEGVFRVRDFRQEEKGVIAFFEGLDDIYSVDQEVAKIFGKLRSELKQEGKVIEDLDILLAATCLAHDLTLVTANAKHFKRIKDLQLLELPLV